MSEKSRSTAGILGIFLGLFGIHKFYLGIPTARIHLIVGGVGLGVLILSAMLAPVFVMTMSATAMAMAGLLGILTVIGWLAMCASGIVGFIEGIMYLTKSDDEFREIYVEAKKPWF